MALLWIFFSGCGLAFGQGAEARPLPSLVEIYWYSSQTVTIPGATSMVVLDPEVARAELGGDVIRFVGLERGETVALGYADGKPFSIRIRVNERPQIAPPPLLGREEMAQGLVSSSLQTSNIDGRNTLAVMNGFSWSQLAGKDGHINFFTQIEDANYSGGHYFNPRTATLLYHDPKLEVQALDFAVNLTNGQTNRNMGPFALLDTVMVRGLDLTLTRGRNQYSYFAGTTLPSFYLTLGSTRDLAGFAFQQQRTEKLALFSSASYINAPTDMSAILSGRRNNFMYTGGFNYLMNDRWAMQATTGASNHGELGRGTLSYVGKRSSLFATASSSPALFPLNQIESIYSGMSSYKAGWTFRITPWLSESVNYQHTITAAAGGIIRAGSSDFVSPGVTFKAGPNQDVSFTTRTAATTADSAAIAPVEIGSICTGTLICQGRCQTPRKFPLENSISRIRYRSTRKINSRCRIQFHFR